MLSKLMILLEIEIFSFYLARSNILPRYLKKGMTHWFCSWDKNSPVPQLLKKINFDFKDFVIDIDNSVFYI